MKNNINCSLLSNDALIFSMYFMFYYCEIITFYDLLYNLGKNDVDFYIFIIQLV